MLPASLALLSLVLAVGVRSDDEPRHKDKLDPRAIVEAFESTLTDAIARADPAVVGVARIKNGDGRGETLAVHRKNAQPRAPRNDVRFVPREEDFQSFDYGSGVVVGDSGEILTAFHVVKGALTIIVRARGTQQFEAEVLAADPRSDLAVIVPARILGVAPPKLKAIAIGDAGKLRKGSFLIALGNSFNAMRFRDSPDAPMNSRDGESSASWGILSNIARRVEFEPGDGGLRMLRHCPTLLQLDAKLNLGMSGGAVVDLRGELVGLTTTTGATVGEDFMAGYAIPLDRLGRRVVETLKKGLEVEYGFLGVGLNDRVTNQVKAINPLTPAGQAGLVNGDVIVEVNNTPVGDGDGLTLALAVCPVGKPVSLKINRNGKIHDLSILLSKFPLRGEVIAANRPDPWRGLRVNFTSMLGSGELTNEILQSMTKGGVGIVEVVAESPAERAGFGAARSSPPSKASRSAPPPNSKPPSITVADPSNSPRTKASSPYLENNCGFLCPRVDWSEDRH